MAIDSNSIEKLLDLVNEGDAQLITEIFAGLDIVIDPEELQRLIDDSKVVDKFLEEQTYGPASPEELREQKIRLLTEAVIPGRDIIIEPFVRVSEGEELYVNGSIASTIFASLGSITDTNNRLGDNLFGEFFLNAGEIGFDGGQDFIISRGSGIINDGLINTGNQLDLISGTATGGNIVDGISNLGEINLGKGNDRLVGNGIGTIDVDGIENRNLITTGMGADLIVAKAVGNDGIAAINNLGSIKTGQGDDRVLGEATDLTGIVSEVIEGGETQGGFSFGISSDINTLIDTGSGADQVVGISTLDDSGQAVDGNSSGVLNQGAFIRLGDGDDELIGQSIASGPQDSAGIAGLATSSELFPELGLVRATIDLGDGNDAVSGFGQSAGGERAGGIALFGAELTSISGNNAIQGEAIGGLITAGILVDSFSTIGLGNGSDSVTGIASEGVFVNAGISNDGLIQLGKGSDLIDASLGGFAGVGETQLGGGDDEIRGFGTGQFFGGGGTDTISLGEGTYIFDSSSGSLNSNGTTMNLRNIEEIKGFNDMQSVALVDGEFIIDSNNMLVAFATDLLV